MENFNFYKKEENILKFWKKNNIFQKSISRRPKSRNFVFYEGPPTANGRPGIHHVLARIFKDIICRYKTMRGFKVLRKAGWDTHGLPVELQIEKKLGLKNKKDIEEYGIGKFNKECQQSVWEYKKDWEKLTERIGYWLDMENPYITYTKNYIESVWWILKEIWKKGLLYQDFKVVPYCPRCGTALSSHEVAQGYKKIKEPAIYVKFKILNPEFKNSSLLVWTTTPWTLPGNVAVAINPKLNYSKVKIDNEFLILAKERMETSGVKGEILEEFKGKDLVNLRYEAPYPIDEEYTSKTAYKVIPADFVSLEEGTGLVHIAPAFGEDDMEAVKTQNSKLKTQNLPEFPILLTVDEEGKFRLEVKKWAGMFVKEADPKIIEDLKNRGLLFKEELYLHDYPFCWRCHTPLLYYAKKSWFIRVTKVKKELIENNQKINWIPAHLKKGRFGEWLREVRDWALSRERYWGTPLPVWQCKSCRNLEVMGSLDDLLSQQFSKNNYFIVRHGHSLRQVKNLASSWPEKTPFPLTKKGEKEVLKIAEELKEEKIDLIFSSDLLRTKQTAKILAKELGAKLFFDKRLREYNVGIFNYQNPFLAWDYLVKKKNYLTTKIPKGESLLGIRKRMYNFFKKINEKKQGKNILIVSHELPLTILEGTLAGFPLEEILERRKRKEIKTIGIGEFRNLKFKTLPFNEKMELDFHRPYIDEVKFYCPKCQGLMERVQEIIDCWFDSGSMPFAQYHYPFENKNLIDKKIQFPADYIAEAIDQTRGWFYTMLAISTLLERGPAYKNVISLSHVLDEKGEKMSKSKGNVVDPWYIVKKYGADPTRWYFYTINQAGDSKLFSEKDIEEAVKRFFFTLWNCYLFLKTYGKLDSKTSLKRSQNKLDKWIISKLNELIKLVTDSLDQYDITNSSRSIEKFVIDNLSLWYIRRSRKRFQRPENEKELKEASQTLSFVLLTLSKLMAPFVPFLSEEIYGKIQNSRLKIKGSVHLENWPKVNKKLIDKNLNQKMEKVREIVALALAERAKARIKVRQPLPKLEVRSKKLEEELVGLIKEEVNVKEVVTTETLAGMIELDTKITPELKEEGILREIIRNLQEMRKIAGFTPKDKILIQFMAEKKLNDILLKNKENILKETKARDLKFGKKEKFKVEKEIKIESQQLWLAIKKVEKNRNKD